MTPSPCLASPPLVDKDQRAVLIELSTSQNPPSKLLFLSVSSTVMKP